MTAEQFEAMPVDKKAAFTRAHGEKISTFKVYNLAYTNLYKTEHFYIEVFYNAKTNTIMDIQTATEEHVLEYYIDLREVYLAEKGLLPPRGNEGPAASLS